MNIFLKTFLKYECEQLENILKYFIVYFDDTDIFELKLAESKLIPDLN